jgi:[ribosomal protein S18]-alanine N-acetyltransferase
MALSREEARPSSLRERAMRETDLEEVMRLERAAYLFPWSEGIFRDCLRVGYLCRVVDGRDGVGGYAIMSMGAGEAHILNLCVRADLRRRGIGRHLLAWLLRRAHSADQDWAFLEVRPSNRPAIVLYQWIGFEAVGLRRGYYQAVGGREDALVYRLNLRTWLDPTRSS